MQFHLTDDFEIILLAIFAVAAFIILMSISFSALVWFIKALARGDNKTLSHANNKKITHTPFLRK